MTSQTISAGTVLSRKERNAKFGVDCPSELRWHGWQAGGDFRKSLLIKNTSKDVLEFRYKIPKNQFFHMEFPEKIRLSPGLGYIVNVNFRPTKKEPYSDVIEFELPTGSFFIQIRATVPVQGITMTQELDFGFCPINEVQTKSFELNNTGEVPIDYELQSKAPFQISPQGGTIQPGTVQQFSCTFSPADASVFTGTVVCKRAGGAALHMGLHGVGKLPFLAASSQEINFGSVVTGKVEHKTFTVFNRSMVHATVTAEPHNPPPNQVFQLSPTAEVIPPGASCEFHITYRPEATGAYSCESFRLHTPGGNNLFIKSSGTSEAHNVFIEPAVVDFGDMDCSKSQRKSQVLDIKNTTNAPVSFQILTGGKFFRFSKTSGTISALSHCELDVSMVAKHAVNLFERVWILVQNQQPLYVDLLGTGFQEGKRPMPFNYDLVTNFRTGEATKRLPIAIARQPSLSGGSNDSPSGQDLWAEFMLPDTDSRLNYCLDPEEVSFGTCSSRVPPDYRQFSIQNNSASKCTVVWEGSDGTGQSHLFEVFPPSCDIGAGASATFKAAFRPIDDGEYSMTTAQAVAYPKTQRNFRLVTEESFVPPSVLSVCMHGHTFSNVAHHVPRCVFTPRNLRFDSCMAGERSYCVVKIENKADTVTVFSFDTDDTAPFNVRPRCGIIQPHQFALVAVEFNPKNSGEFFSTVKCSLNHQTANATELNAFGVASAAILELDQPNLVMPPTCVGAITTRVVTMSNPSGIPLYYNWEISEAQRRMLWIEPANGVVQPGETSELRVHFQPRRVKSHNFRPKMQVHRHDGACGVSLSPEIVLMNVSGEGAHGKVMFDPPELDLGVQLVGSPAERLVEIVNHSDVLLRYVLSYQDLGEEDEGDVDENFTDIGQPTVAFDCPEGFLPAHARKRVLVTFSPTRRRYYDVRITARLGTGSEIGDQTLQSTLRHKPDSLLPMLPLQSNVVYPTMAFVDARAEALPTERIFRDFRLVQINRSLHTDLTAREYNWNAGTENETDPEKVLEVFEVDFKAKEVGSTSSVVRMLIENTGHLPATFKFIFPKDGEDEPDNWVDSDLLNDDELTRDLILENKLFQVHPKQGRLQAGERCEVLMCYQHKFASDLYRLPVIFQVVDGKAVVMGFRGQTLQVGQKHLSVAAAPPPFLPKQVGFQPVTVGSRDPPIQYMELRNTSEVAFEWALDLEKVEQLCADNHNFPVLQLIDSPAGTLEPGRVEYLRWIFKPIEVKEYRVNVQVAVLGGAPVDVELVGKGIMPNPEEPDLPALPLPPRQLIPIPSQPVTVSCERFVLGAVPIGAVVSSLVILKNVSEKPWVFEWDLDSSLSREVLSCYPQQHELFPGEVCLARVIMKCSFSTQMDYHVPLLVHEPAPPPNDEEELDDDDDENRDSNTASNTAPPPTAGSTSRSGMSNTSNAKANKKKLRQSVIGRQIGQRFKHTQTTTMQGVVTFDDSPRKGRAGSPHTAYTGVSQRTGATGMTSASQAQGNALARTVVQMAVPTEDYDWSQAISVQVHAREPIEHRDLYKDLDQFWVPRDLPLPPVHIQTLNESLTKSSKVAATTGRGSPSRGATSPASQTGEQANLTQLFSGTELHGTANDILRALLQDIVSDADVQTALQAAKLEPTPNYVQMVSRPPTPYKLTTPHPSQPPTPRFPAEELAATGGLAESIAGATGEATSQSLSLHTESEIVMDDERATLLAMHSSEFANVAHFVMDGCLFNVLGEAATGEWQPWEDSSE